MARLVSDIGGEAANDGERRVITRLIGELPDKYGVLPNIELIDRSRRTLEIDAIVTAPHAVYVVEIKDYRGSIEGDHRQWFRNGRTERSPIVGNNFKAKVVKSTIEEANPLLKGIWVQQLVVIAHDKPHLLKLRPEARAETLLLSELVPRLRDPGQISGRPVKVDPAAIESILAPKVRKRSGPQKFGSWLVQETLKQDGDVAHYRARNELASKAPERRLTVWGLSNYLFTEKERLAERNKVVRDFTALTHMGAHPGIVGATEAFEEGDAVVVVSEPPAGTTLGLMLNDELALTDDERLSYLDQLADAVGHAHEHEVIHRRISPDAVVIDGAQVRLGEFGHARIAAEGTIHHDPASIDAAAEGYIAPEVRDASLGEVTDAADMFSVAAIAWTLWAGERLPGLWTSMGPTPDRPAEMPDGVWAVVDKLLRIPPAERDANLGDLRDAIAQARATTHDPRQPDGPAPVLPTAPAEYAVGDTIAKRYTVQEKLGFGTFATVYRVHDGFADVERALKLLQPKYELDRAQREVRSLEDITHPNVVRVWHLDKTPTEPAQWYIVSELATGAPLSTLTESGQRLPLDRALRVADQLLDACAHFHPDQATGGVSEHATDSIVHRDIKPGNVMYDAATGHAKLLDFNVASRAGSDVGTYSGTPGYQPPEPDPKEWGADPDLFAIGVVLFELLTGEHPYPDGRPTASTPKRLASMLADTSRALDDFCARACDHRRDERFASAAEMRTALHAAAPEIFAAANTAPSPASSATTRLAPTGVAATDVAATPVATTPVATTPPRQVTQVQPMNPTMPNATAMVQPPARGGAPTPPPPPPPPPDGGHGPGRNGPGGPSGWSGRKLVVAMLIGVVAALAVWLVITLAAGGSDDPKTDGGRAVETDVGQAVGGDVGGAAEAAPEGQHCPAGFPVKGNVSTDDLIYHEPGWRYFDSTWPEQCFATAEAAEEAGFRASKVK